MQNEEDEKFCVLVPIHKVVFMEEDLFSFNEKKLRYYGRLYSEEFICNLEEVLFSKYRKR